MIKEQHLPTGHIKPTIVIRDGGGWLTVTLGYGVKIVGFYLGL